MKNPSKRLHIHKRYVHLLPAPQNINTLQKQHEQAAEHYQLPYQIDMQCTHTHIHTHMEIMFACISLNQGALSPGQRAPV